MVFSFIGVDYNMREVNVRYKNPIIPGFYPDPSICKKGEDYYLVASSFEFFPGVPVFHSRDLINWEQIGHCLTRKSQLDLDGAAASKGIYAPTIRYHEGLFYMVTTNTTKIGNFYVTAEDPAGEWSDPIKVEQGGIDPSLFWDDDGTCYFISNAKDVYGSGSPAEKDGPQSAQAGPNAEPPGFLMGPIDTKTGKFIASPRPVWGGCGGAAPEAPHIYKINGWYYQLIAEGGTENGHMITIARSRELFGPYEGCPHNPILTHRHRKGQIIQGTGHGDLIEDNDHNWWVVFLGFRQTSQYFHHLGRETFLAPVKWTDGWPIVNNGDAIAADMEVGDVRDAEQAPRQFAVTDFSKGLPINWAYLRNPVEADYRFNNDLNLRGNIYTLSDMANPTFAGMRQADLDMRASVELVFEPSGDNEEAGFSVFYKNDAHYEIALTRRAGARIILLRKVVGDICHIETAPNPTKSHSVTLGIDSDKDRYRFYYIENGKTVEMGGGFTRHVSTEAHVLGFTGVFLALYASGNGKACTSWARFGAFRYKGLDR